MNTPQPERPVFRRMDLCQSEQVRNVDGDQHGDGTSDDGGQRSRIARSLSQSRLRELLGEVQQRIEQIVRTRDQMDRLMDAVLAISSGLELDAMLRRIVTAAVDLVDAEFGALGVLSADRGSLDKFVHVGVDEDAKNLIGDLPKGRGLLGAVIEAGKPVRVDNVSVHPASADFPANHPSIRSFLGVPVQVRDEVFGNLYLTGKRGGDSFTEDDEMVLTALAAAAGVAIENAYLYETTRRRQRWLEATGEVTTELLRGTEPDDVLHRIADRALQLGEADYTIIALPVDPDAELGEGGLLVVAVSSGPDIAGMTGRRIPIEGSTSGSVFRDQVPRNVPELAFDVGAELGIRFGPALALPLRGAESVTGVLLAARRPGAPMFDEHQLDVVSSFADQAALALQLARSQATRRELDVLADRDRIARDLHDHVIQRLFAIGLAMQGTQRRAKNPAVAERIATHIDQLHEVIQEIRTAIFDLHQGVEPEARLRTRLNEAVTELTGDTALRTTVRMSGPLDLLSVELAGHAEAVVRETVSNAVRHAEATDLTVVVSVEEDLVVDVTDNGTGMRETSVRSGLRNLERRAADMSGTMTVTQGENGGTRVCWTAPWS
jgi:signal transduction histidine kinase